MKLIDMHCDTISELYKANREITLEQNSLCVDKKGLKQAGTFIQFFACFVNVQEVINEEFSNVEKSKKKKNFSEQSWECAWRREIQLLDYLQRMIENDSELNLIQSKTDIAHYIKEQKICVLAAVEEGGILQEDIKRLDELYEKGVRLLTLSWNYENCIGYPNSWDRNLMKKGLKDFGREVVCKMNEKGMLIDVSHLSDSGFWDCIKESKSPIVASHSNARTLCNHPRNLSDDMLKVLGECGGVAGLNFYPFFVKENGIVGIEHLAEHAKYMVNKAGEDSVGIGSDFDGFSYPGEKEDRINCKENYIFHVREMEKLWIAMKKIGLTERQLEKIQHKNVLRVIREVLR